MQQNGHAIDICSGKVVLDDVALSLAPTLTREAFLASELGQDMKVNVDNEPWCSWNLGRHVIGGRVFVIVVYFHGSVLAIVDLMDPDERFGTSWEDWSVQKELQRKASHEQWLAAILSAEPEARDRNSCSWSYRWGSTTSGFDERGGFSSIWIRYR